ncbi:ABC transporter substrate-binding protein [bacterium]|nr:ABC transporter substrate-binding protein [candidate division CSSED10-310 bacterium]
MKLHRFTWLIAGLLLIYPGSLAADKEPKVLVINSDAGIEKYKVAQEEFTGTLSRPVRAINLDDPKWKIADVENLLYDEYPDLVYCIGSKAYLIAHRFISEKDIVFSSIVNWQRFPVTGKTYGVSVELHSGIQMTLFRYIFPKVKKIGVLYSTKYNSEWFKNTSTESKEMGIEIVGKSIAESKQSIDALRESLPAVDALWLIPDPLLMEDKDNLMKLFKACESRKLPVFSYHDSFIDYGALLVVSVDAPTIGRQAAGIAAEILSDGTIDEKVQYPAGSHIILNLKKVKEYGLQYNEAALSAVNQIVE